MKDYTLIAIDLAKNVFQVCGMTSNMKVVFNKKISRKELFEFMANQHDTAVAMEACYSSHYWARTFERMGHTVRLIPAQHVAPFVRGNKSDRNDVVAIAEAACRPNIIPVPVKSIEQQDIQSLHRIRDRYVSNRTGLMNQLRGLLSEYGIIAPLGHKAFCLLLRDISDESSTALTPLLKQQVRYIADEYYQLSDRIKAMNHQLQLLAEQHPLCQRLLSLPGVGALNATAIYSAIGNGSQFKNGREFAVWLGLTPRQSSSGESFKSGGITKRGNGYLRKQLVHGARAAAFRCKKKKDALSVWTNQLLERRGAQKTYVALAAKMARIAWVLLQREEHFIAR